jgi:polyisoprenoid-binding protein YceI
MRLALTALALATAAVPVIAQMPTTPPGAPDPARVKAGTYAVDSHHTQILFQVNHLGFNSYYGIFGGGTGSLTLDPAKPATASVSIEIPINLMVTTSNELNTHLKTPDFFDAAKFPTATFKSTSVAVDGAKAKITGNLTLKGVTKPVVLDAWFTGAGLGPMNKAETVGFEATTTVKRSDFGISYGVPLVSDEVPLKITVAFEKKP